MSEAYEIPSLKDLPQELVDNTTAMLASRLAEYNPDIDFNRRASFLLLPYMHGLLLAGTTENLINELATNNLASLIDGTATDAQADDVAKAFGITRKPAQKAKLYVMIVLDRAVPFSLSTGDTFNFNGVSFSPESSVSVRTSSATVGSGSDYILVQIGTGKWGVVLPLTATVEGAEGNLPPGTVLTPSKTITALVKASVVSSLQSGYEQETNQQMAERVTAASSIKTWASRSSFEAIARQGSTYPDLVAISVCGFGDEEQRRDRRGVLPVAHGGRTDLWVKFRPGLYYDRRTVTAVLVSKVGAIGTWSFTLNGSEFPAVNKVLYVADSTDQSGDTFEPVSETWSLGVPVGVVVPRLVTERYVPDVRTAVEAAFSPYSNVTIMFEDYRYDVTSVTVGATRSYQAYINYEPLAETFQQELGSQSTANPATDVVVRTAIPCEVAVTVAVKLYPGKTAPNTTDISNAVVEFINNTSFPGSISASDISSAVGAVINNAGTIIVDNMSGRLRKPDGTWMAIISTGGQIEVPDLPTEMVTGNTVAFYSDSNQVSVVIQ